MRRLLRVYAAFAARSQRVISHPFHFAAFLFITVVIWAPWAAHRGFDPFSQLWINTPTTIAEYAFAILTLEAALQAADKADEALTTLERIERHILSDVESIAAAEGVHLTEKDDER